MFHTNGKAIRISEALSAKALGFMRKVLLVILILPLFGLLFTNTVYMHQHVLPDGTIVEHAHYHRSESSSESGGQDHHHTEKEFLLYSLISETSVLAECASLLPEALQLEAGDFAVRKEQKLSLNSYRTPCRLRGPPASLSLS